MVVSVDTVKQYLRVQYDDEDNLLESLVMSAQAHAENYCRTSFDEDAPAPVKQAILAHVSYFYEYRDGNDTASYATMKRAVENLLYPYRVPELMF